MSIMKCSKLLNTLLLYWKLNALLNRTYNKLILINEFIINFLIQNCRFGGLILVIISYYDNCIISCKKYDTYRLDANDLYILRISDRANSNIPERDSNKQVLLRRRLDGALERTREVHTGGHPVTASTRRTPRPCDRTTAYGRRQTQHHLHCRWCANTCP